MKYNFLIEKVSLSKYFSIEIITPEHYVLNNFRDTGWTPQKVQSIIDGVHKSKNNDPEKSFDWGNEDVYMRSNKYGVFFIISPFELVLFRDNYKIVQKTKIIIPDNRKNFYSEHVGRYT